MCVPAFARGGRGRSPSRATPIPLPLPLLLPPPPLAQPPCSASASCCRRAPLLAVRAWTGPSISLARRRWWQRWLVVRGGRKKEKKKKSRGALRCSAPVGVTRFGLSLSLSFFLSRTKGPRERRCGVEGSEP
ncbi:hypothetical protein GQ55_5G219100 [Panicum hallii var. hallii]|uniref:Uncharacterized protein n=1 Tax=Panicum hallii var. hallii TaxID=1504633 RepID=A0A2T7DIW4_9POAL|nr:hypothetical protein GQ55_5G219100 [Panicum hallii var. hallii]